MTLGEPADDRLMGTPAPGLLSRTERLRRFPRILRQALRLVWASGRRQFVLTSGLQVLQGVGVAAQLLAGRRVLQALFAARESGTGFGGVVPALALLVGLTVVLSAAASVQVEQSRVLGELVARAASGRVLDVAESVPLETFEYPRFFDRLERAQVAALTRPLELVDGLGTLATSLLTVAGIGIALIALRPILAVFLVVGYVPLWYAATRNSRALYQFVLDMTEDDRHRAYLERVLSGRDEAKEVRAFGLGPFLRQRYDRLYEDRIRKLRHVARRRLGRSLLASFGGSGLTAASLGLLGYLYVDGRLSLPTLGASIGGLLQLGGKLSGATAGAAALYESALFVDDYESFLELGARTGSASPAVVPLEPFEHLVVDGVTFTYPGTATPALHDISLEIRAGEVVALVGRNGSGKTTLAKLLALLYAPDTGRILWDELEMAPKEWGRARGRIAVIFQDFVRYLLPAGENIGAGRHERLHDTRAVVEAARAAGADDFVSRLPRGYDTVLGKEFKHGTDLSIGQWQRLALARAFFRDAPFVILDEPTSAIDPMAERELLRSVESLFADRSVLLISHRLSSVRRADRIYLLEAGRIVERGTHDELMAGDGIYAELFTAQAAAYASRPVENRGPPAGGRAASR